jgi:hypothetical protein
MWTLISQTASGLWLLSQTAAGTEQSFIFTPNSDADTEATGKLIIDPLPFGGDETGTTMAADFEFAMVGKPTYTQAGGAAVRVGGNTPDPHANDAPADDAPADDAGKARQTPAMAASAPE